MTVGELRAALADANQDGFVTVAIADKSDIPAVTVGVIDSVQEVTERSVDLSAARLCVGIQVDGEVVLVAGG